MNHIPAEIIGILSYIAGTLAICALVGMFVFPFTPGHEIVGHKTAYLSLIQVIEFLLILATVTIPIIVKILLDKKKRIV